MLDIYIIIEGFEDYGGGEPTSIFTTKIDKLKGYYDKRSSAEAHLINNGYELDKDGVYFKSAEDREYDLLAKIMPLQKLY